MRTEFSDCLEDLRPIELVMYTKLALLSLAEAPQAWRDTLSAEIANVVDQQCYAAAELGDARAFGAYIRAGRFVVRNIERYGNGPNFIKAQS
jgi:hypothetical protein